MDTETERSEEGGQESSGKGLRAQLESTIAERDRYRAEVAELRAREVLRSGNFSFVGADDLKGVDPDKVEERAKALQEERAKVFRQGIEARFRQQGLTGEELDRAVEQFLDIQPSSEVSFDEQAAYSRARSAGAGASPTPPPLVNPEKMSAQEKIEHALRHAPSKRR